MTFAELMLREERDSLQVATYGFQVKFKQA